MKIWIVQGSTGEYSDRTEWAVCAYKSEGKAQARVLELEALISSFTGRKQDGPDEWFDSDKRVECMREHPHGDPHYQEYYTSCSGTAYTCYPVEMLD